jgi:G3E family GTPase
VRTPITLITGPLGSGKTTLLRHILDCAPLRFAVLMNEFGEIAIDSKIIEGKNVRIAELPGGCVCCSLQGEFEAAVVEVLESVDPEWIVVETTGLAEPEALVFDIQDSLPQLRLDGIVTVADADALLRFPQVGHTARMQLEMADLVLLNKVDLAPPEAVGSLEEKLRSCNADAPILHTRRARVDADLLFGIGRDRTLKTPGHRHQPEYEAFGADLSGDYGAQAFNQFAGALEGLGVYRAKGFLRLDDQAILFNYVAGRWEFEPFPAEQSALVFIGKSILTMKAAILARLEACRI